MVQTDGPILGLCFMVEQPALLLAHSDNTIKKWDFTQQQQNPQGALIQQVGAHSQPVKDIYYMAKNNQNILVSGGWDCKVKFWQWNSP